jgi:hypothetical protein
MLENNEIREEGSTRPRRKEQQQQNYNRAVFKVANNQHLL